MSSDIIQLMILICSAVSIWLVARTDKLHRWGFVVGLFGQPFWLWETYHSEQYGMFLLSGWYVYVWGKGIYVRFIK